ncbi:MAG: hypothetical protein RQ763_04675 [Sulfurimonas sp.]|uniref:hypothetical protein n=1 Tax=Sulfurimonas sp. TaxID=2022749 RepID=UPI0028CDCDEE|nr:hypothetical protein [Sulfurimonas sp.]MDT8338475.1 hypothetical protein [Sulfurimonas sp.]
MKSCIKYLVIIGMVSVSSILAQDNYYGSGNGNSGYKSNSGQTYQYDMNNGNDRLKYSTDTDAQQRDMRSNMYDNSANIDRQRDGATGQYGGGIYGN